MKHLQSYNNFNKVNEELTTSDKRSIRFIPQAILGFLGKKLLGIYPMLNLRWREMKRATTGLKDSPFTTGDTGTIKYELVKMNIDDLPDNKLKLAMFLRDWNLYLAKDYKSTGGGEQSMSYVSNDKLVLTGSDIDTLLSDLDNCTKSWSLNVDLERHPERADDLKERNKVTEIELKQVLIEFRKVS